jgi:hypothetical protein
MMNIPSAPNVYVESPAVRRQGLRIHEPYIKSATDLPGPVPLRQRQTLRDNGRRLADFMSYPYTPRSGRRCLG